MKDNNRIKMPFGAAISCILITVLVIVSIAAVGRFIKDTADNAFKKDALETNVPITPSQSNEATATEAPLKLPSDSLVYSEPQDMDDAEYAIIDQCMSAVVSIDVTMQNGYTSVLAGSGSGVIVSSDGYILTCNHVVEGAESIIVYLNNGDTYQASLIGLDNITDLAVIKIEDTDLPYARLGDSSTLRIGESVFAVGNALGELSNTYTSGSISGLDRIIEIDGRSMTLMQTDAAINQGNSGGGLFRASDGTLIGIVNAKSSGSGIEGLGFAIPSSLVSEIASDLMDYGFVSGRPYLGVATRDVVMSGFFIFDQQHTYPRVTSVDENSPAANAGIEVNDIILAINDQSVAGSEALSILISELNIGDTIKVTVQRGNASVDIDVTLSERQTR